MLSLALLFLSMPLIGGVPWYPVIFPVPTNHQHRHTTHIVTQPVMHTRVLVLEEEDDDDHSHPSHSHSHSHHRKFDDNQVRHSSYGTTSRDPVASRHYESSYNPHGGHSYDDFGSHNHRLHSQGEGTKYSLPVDESPWKPLPGVHSRYLPLKYLGIDERQVARVVKEAMDEIDEDIDLRSKHRYPTAIQDVIGRRPAMKSYLNPSGYRGAVFYDDDHRPQARKVITSPGYVSTYDSGSKSVPSGKKALNLNIQCQCQTPVY